MSISVKNITKSYANKKALDNVSFNIEQGEIVGFLGPNGAGKSTMMKIITGYLPQDQGDVYIMGLKMDANNVNLKHQIGYLPEHNPLYLEMYVWEFLEFSARLTGVKRKKNRIAEVIHLVGLESEQNKIIENLSKGYRQRVGLAHAILHDPKVLILDEPTTGLDPNQIVEIRKLIHDIGKNKTVMLSTHIMQEVEAICNRVIIIDHGSLVADHSIVGLNEIGQGHRIIRIQLNQNIDSEIFKVLPEVISIDKVADCTYELRTDLLGDARPKLFALAVEKEWTILELAQIDKPLEQVFHDLTSIDKDQ